MEGIENIASQNIMREVEINESLCQEYHLSPEMKLTLNLLAIFEHHNLTLEEFRREVEEQYKSQDKLNHTQTKFPCLENPGPRREVIS